MKLTINNENIYFEQTDKYKTIAIGVMMFTPFKKEYSRHSITYFTRFAKGQPLEFPA